MKFPALAICILALLAGCTKKDDPQTSTGGNTGASNPAPAAKVSVTNNGASVNASVAVSDFSTGKDNSNITYNRAIVEVYFPDINGPSGGVKYYLSSLTPGWAVQKVVNRNVGNADYNYPASGTLTGRTLVVNNITHLYLSGTFTASMGTNYKNVVGTFTDVQAY